MKRKIISSKSIIFDKIGKDNKKLKHNNYLVLSFINAEKRLLVGYISFIQTQYYLSLISFPHFDNIYFDNDCIKIIYDKINKLNKGTLKKK